MRSRVRRFGSTPRSVALFAVALFVAGAAAFFGPPLIHKHRAIIETAGPPPLFALGEFQVAAGQQACMEKVSLLPHGDVAQFLLPGTSRASGASAAIELVLTAPGYVARAQLPPGHPGGPVALPISAPSHSELGTVCLVNRGPGVLVLLGSKEARSFPRSQLVIAGTSVVGELSLAFLESHTHSLLERVGTVFSHASNLTEHLIPVWLIWILAAVFALGLPAAMLGAFYLSLAQDEARPAE
jgi:hypothetical protein